MSVHAPYNFVPLSGFVHKPEWAARASHDIPFQDGLSGSFQITITAESKILIGGKRGTQDAVDQNGNIIRDRKGRPVQIQTVHPYELPDGTYAIPERTLRGMIRNVIEIATFGRMQFADNKRYGIRDLTPAARKFYQERLVSSSGGNPVNVDINVKAGWLKLDGNEIKIIPCSMARVHFSELERLGAIDGSALDRKSDAPARYRAWTGSLKHTLWVRDKKGHTHQGGRLRIHYSKATVNDPRDGAKKKKGQIVLTGKASPGRGPGKKKMEFFFYDPRPDKALTVAPEVFQAFKDIHDPDDGRKPNPGWKYWKAKLNRGQKVPVFYILDDAGKKVDSFGLAMMFKLAHKRSVKEMLKQTSPQHTGGNLLDMASLLFGVIADQDNKKCKGLKARVNMGLARRTKDAGGSLDEPVTILAGPKASYYPSYVRQPVRGDRTQNGARLKGDTYATYTPLEICNSEDKKNDSEDDKLGKKTLCCPEIRGWKRYPAGRSDEVTDESANPNHKVKVFLKPLPKGTQFTSTVRFHNLRPKELGALLWALEWGGATVKNSEKLRHRIGMAKPYGYGQVRIEVDEASWTLMPNNPDSNKTWTKEELIGAFVKHMDEAYKEAAKRDNVSWQNSEQIQQLLAMADPEKAGGRNLTYMKLEMQGENEFLNAKGRRERRDKNTNKIIQTALPSTVLPDWIGPKRQPDDHTLFPRTCHTPRQPAPAGRNRQQQRGNRQGTVQGGRRRGQATPRSSALTPAEEQERLEVLRRAREAQKK